MKVKLVTIGTKMPSWIIEGTDEYLKRLSAWSPIHLVELALAKRNKNDHAAEQVKYRQIEGQQILQQIQPQDYVVTLEVLGKAWSTPQLAKNIEAWNLNRQDVVLVIGGPDGLSDEVKQRANQEWSLSPLTLPHPIARLIVIEQLYRATSILKGHPYHRE